MMQTEEYPMRQRVKNLAINRKEEAKLKSMAKEQERRGRDPSCRLGKIAKKLAGRIAKILELEKEADESKDETIGVKPLRMKLIRSKRKVGHRVRCEEELESEEEPEIEFTKEEIAWQTASLNEDDTITM